MEIRKGDVMDIKCPACGSEDVNVIDAPIVIQNTPWGHNWYGQLHKTKAPMVCDSCKTDFWVTTYAYKNRASVRVELR